MIRTPVHQSMTSFCSCLTIHSIRGYYHSQLNRKWNAEYFQLEIVLRLWLFRWSDRQDSLFWVGLWQFYYIWPPLPNYHMKKTFSFALKVMVIDQINRIVYFVHNFSSPSPPTYYHMICLWVPKTTNSG